VAAFRGLLEHDRKQAGWSVEQAAWRLVISVREYRELEAGARAPSFETLGSDLQAVRVARDVVGR